MDKNTLVKILSTDKYDNKLHSKARKISQNIFGNKIYVRGLIEFTNYCTNGCYYCGINANNTNLTRYRLNKKDILEACYIGNSVGIKTFVLQGGEDPYYTDDILVDIISSIKSTFPSNAITLSIGEKSYKSYKKFYDAGASRFLLRHETSNNEHYAKLHPQNLKLENRLNCLNSLKEIGYQTGCGIMIGSPYQSIEDIADDIIFMYNFKPQMIGIGPFISHKDTIFKDFKNGSVSLTLRVLAILRILMPNLLLPSTTALGTLSDNGRENGILAGCNVIMPNITPKEFRAKYNLYDNKICQGEETLEGYTSLKEQMHKINYILTSEIGDYKI